MKNDAETTAPAPRSLPPELGRMSTRPSIAVVIPTHNRAERVLRTLDSVFGQEETAAEIIVVDDCSTDETQAVIEDLLAPHPELRYIRHEVNQERAASRNTGMSRATADYVTFLDSDDIMYPQNLREAADFIVETDAKFFHNLAHLVDDTGRHIRNLGTPSLKNHLKSLALYNCLWPAVFLHRQIYTEYRFDTEPILTASEDYEFMLRVAADYRVQRIARINTAIVKHPDRSMMKQELAAAQERMEFILEKVRLDPHLRRTYAPYLGRMHAGRMLILASFANDHRQSAEAIRYLRRAVMKYPVIATHPRFVRCLQLAILNAIRGGEAE